MILICLTLLITVCSAAPSSRIVNGDNATIGHDWKWQLSLQYRPNASYAFGHICGASLISKKYAITAAHCIDHHFDGDYAVIAGEHNFDTSSGDEQWIEIAGKLVHHQYDGSVGGFPNDIAILELAHEATLNNYVQPATLPTSTSTTFYNNGHCYITGWGRLNGGGNVPSILQEAKTTVISQNSCVGELGITGVFFLKQDLHICVYSGQNGACNGDSGGPLVCEVNGQWELAGATSWGLNGCPTSSPSVYVRVSNYLSWIIQNTDL